MRSADLLHSSFASYDDLLYIDPIETVVAFVEIGISW